MVKRVLRELKDDKGKVKQWQEENVSEHHPKAHENDPRAPYSTHIQDESDAAKAAGIPDAQLQSNKSKKVEEDEDKKPLITTKKDDDKEDKRKQASSSSSSSTSRFKQ